VRRSARGNKLETIHIIWMRGYVKERIAVHEIRLIVGDNLKRKFFFFLFFLT
jgi:hypothetical protein